jgi:hypothetical protein
MLKIILASISPLVFTLAPVSAASQFKLEKSIDIATVPAGFPVGFCLLTDGARQYVAYYDHQRRMTIASRTVDSDTWQSKVLPTQVGWDSHNYITMAIDRDGHLHVSGNMHAVKLIYFRTEKPADITTLKRFSMTGKLEGRATYPRFMTDHNGTLIFTYHKSDANGNMQIYVTRREAGRWVKHLLTDWTKRVKFSGNGSMGFIGIRISGLSRVAPGVPTMSYRHRDYGTGHLVLDEKTLKPLDQKIDPVREYPAALNRVQSDFPGMHIRRASDIGTPGKNSVRYILQGETLGRNRDRARQAPLPGPSMLRLHQLTESEEPKKQINPLSLF